MYRSLLNKIVLTKSLQHVTHRSSSYYSSPFLTDLPQINVKYETSKDPEDWKYVERALPPEIVPTPVPKNTYPSEWKPAAKNLTDQAYYIARTRNHMVPVYLVSKHHNTKRTTLIRKIQGDIWLMEKELRQFLQKHQERPIKSQVNEFAGYIRFNGDHVNAVKYYLTQKNF